MAELWSEAFQASLRDAFPLHRQPVTRQSSLREVQKWLQFLLNRLVSTINIEVFSHFPRHLVEVVGMP